MAVVADDSCTADLCVVCIGSTNCVKGDVVLRCVFCVDKLVGRVAVEFSGDFTHDVLFFEKFILQKPYLPNKRSFVNEKIIYICSSILKNLMFYEK